MARIDQSQHIGAHGQKNSFQEKSNLENKIAETAILFDIYGSLLTEKKQTAMELYYEENLSLSEIAEEQGISRAAVHDALRSSEKTLLEYEEKLGLAMDYERRRETLAELKSMIHSVMEENLGGVKKAVLKDIDELLARLEE